MRIPRLYVETALSQGESIALPQAPAHHLVRVLRARTGQAVVLFNGDGRDWPGTLVEAGREGAVVEIGESVDPGTAPSLRIGLAQALAKGEKMDAVLRRAVELGVTTIRPLATTRCDVRLSGAREEKRMAHWQGIIVSACEQCGRAELPELEPVAHLHELEAPGALLALLPGAARPLSEAWNPSEGPVTVVVGPEGGLDDAEVAMLRERGARSVGLGPRVLRTETAGPAVLAVLQALYGDWR
ncbi:MAG: 16S rRNA (uracil(1498)-N(3))-methyltransferase [Wenzhouxiangellaceae bacterium]|nr:16S rRNA (uracil(1498)-N(3))-methyltransferase [Wenzhouxiangellaceae bacterium]